VGSIGEVKCECCFYLGSALRTNTTAIAAATTTKHLTKQIAHATCTHIAVVETK
jgi:hypothetical protein